ncbi:MAG: DUF6427 family protein [Flavobacteriaceae bacterium]|nr:DUF6427 family protein [Flavobacteriaceae bacterium]
MIANFFDKTKPINFLVLSIIMAIVYIIGGLNFFEEDITFFLFLKKSAFLLLAILVIFFLNFIIRKNFLTDNNTYALLFFILLLGLFSNVFFNRQILISNFILLFAFRRIYSLRTVAKTKEKIFDAGFWIGLASLFYNWSIIYILLLYGAIWIFRKRDWKNMFIPIVGVVTPVFLLFVYLLVKNDAHQLVGFFNFHYSLDFQKYTFLPFLIPIIFIMILGLTAIIPTTQKSLLSKIDFKSTWQILILQILLSLFIVILAPMKDGSEFLFLFFPLSILFANYFQGVNRYWVKEMILYLFVLLLIGVKLL